MGSLQGAELQQGLKPANLELFLGEQRGWVTVRTGPRMGTPGPQQGLSSGRGGRGAEGEGGQDIKQGCRRQGRLP